MTDEENGTTEDGGEAQSGEPEGTQTGTPNQPDEVTKLRSRNAGLDAKVTSLTKSEKAAIARAEAAEARALELAASKDGGDAELRAQLQAKEAELAEARLEARLNKLAGEYPETFAVLGEAAANLSPDKLAEAEARFSGVAEIETPPQKRPIGNNPSKGTEKPTEETSSDIEARLRSMGLPDWAT